MPRKTILCTAFVLAILALILAGNGGVSAVAGTSTPNVSGTWQGSWRHQIGSGQITLRLAQEGTKVIGQQSVVNVMPVFGSQQQTYTLGQDIQDGELEDSTLTFHVGTQGAPVDRVNFTLTVSGDSMTGTVCGFTCGKMRLTKSPFWGEGPGGTGLPLPSPPARGSSLAVTADSANASFRTLSGRWLRPDGGYILDIRNVKAGCPGTV
jgi:hypothetical protein